jgi:hypothetical protein
MVSLFLMVSVTSNLQYLQHATLVSLSNVLHDRFVYVAVRHNKVFFFIVMQVKFLVVLPAIQSMLKKARDFTTIRAMGFSVKLKIMFPNKK